MANKQVFTAFDVYGFKKALSLWTAKNNALIEKYEELLKILNLDEDDLLSQSPSLTRDSSLNCIACKRILMKMILEDLRMPCDLFISKFEESEVIHG